MAFNRSLAVKSQWRDRKGRWVEMGRGVRFYNPISGSYEIGTFDGPTSDGKAKIKLKNGKTITAPKSAVESYSVKARLDKKPTQTKDPKTGEVKATLPEGTGKSNLTNATYNENGDLTLSKDAKKTKVSDLSPGDTFYHANDPDNPTALETEQDGIPASSLITDKNDKEITYLDPEGNEKKMSTDEEVFQQDTEDEDEAIKANIISEEKHLEKAPLEDPYEPTDPNKTNFGPLGVTNPQRIKNDTLPKDYPETTTQQTPSTTETPQVQENPLDAHPDIVKHTPEALPGEKFAPTQEQQDVIDAVLSNKDVKVSAKAGAGKTSTLEALSRRIEKDEPNSRALYIAFNKSVQTEAEGRMPKNVEPRTGHSLAYQWASKDKNAKVLIEKQSKKGAYKGFTPITRTSDIAKHLDIQDLPDGIKNDDSSKKKSSIASGVVEAVKNFQTSADDNISTNHLPDRFSEFSDEEKAYITDKAQAYWNDMFDPKGKLPPNFDTYRKAWALSKPDLSSPSKGGGKKKANILYIDEAQDTPPVLAKVVADQKMRKVIVGDASQAIYGFTGAKDYLSEADADIELPLTQSFRFGPAVADAGNRFLQLIGDKHRVVGGGPESKITHGMENPDAILVRSNRGLIQESINELKKDRVVAVPKGTKSNLTSLVDSVLFLKGGFGNNKPKKMHEDLESFNNWNEVHEEIESSGNQGLKSTAALFDNLEIDGQTGLDAVFMLKDRLKTIKEPGDASSKVALTEDSDSLTLKDTGTVGWSNSPIQTLSVDYAKSNGTKVPYTKGDYQAYINNLESQGGISTRGWTKKSENKGIGTWEFQGTPEELAKEKEFINKEFLGNGDVMISTAHKSKGLEWDRVKIGDDFGAPEYDEETGETLMPSKDELMLDYVSVTRAKKELDPGSLDWVYDYSDENGGVPQSEEKKAELPEADAQAADAQDSDESPAATDLDMTEDIEESNAQEDSGAAEEPEGSDANVPETEEPTDSDSDADLNDGVEINGDDFMSPEETEDFLKDSPEAEEEKPTDENGNSVDPADLQPGDTFEDSEGNSYTTEKVSKNGVVIGKDNDGEIEGFLPDEIHNSKSKDDEDIEKNPDSKQRSLNEDNDGDDTADKVSPEGLGGPGTPPEPPLPEWIPGDVNKPGEGGPASTPSGDDSTPATAPSAPETPGEPLPDGTDTDVPSSDDSTSPSEAPTAPDADQDTPDEEAPLYGPGTYDERDQNIPSVDLLKKFANKQSGSNPGGFYEDPATGRQFYVKEAKDESHALNEALASKFYSEAGIPNAEQHARMLPNGKWGTVSEVVPDPQSDLYDHIKDGDQEYLDQIRQGFAVDAWLANWDVAGLSYDNIVTDENGQPVRIDPGGSLLYRAQGAPKGNAFGNDATEWESLRGKTSMNSTATPIFEDMNDQQLFDSASKVMAFSDEDIDNIVDSLFFEGGTDADTIKEKLKARRDSISERADQLDVSDDYKSQDAEAQESADNLDTTQSDLANAISNEPGMVGEDDSKEWDLTPAFTFLGDKYDAPEDSEPGYTTTGGYTDAAQEALEAYVDESGDINAILRGDENHFKQMAAQIGDYGAEGFKDEADAHIYNLKTLMQDLPEDVKKTYRGMNIGSQSSATPETLEYYNALNTPGSVVVSGGFTSTSLNEKTANAFADINYDNGVDMGDFDIPSHAVIEIDTSKNIKGHKLDYDELGAGYDNEEEVLLDTDTIFVTTKAEVLEGKGGNKYTKSYVTAYPKSALTDGTLQKDFPEYDFPTLGKDNNGAGEEGTGDSEGDSTEVPAPATDGEGLGQAQGESITTEQITDGSIDFQSGDRIDYVIGGITRRAVKQDDGSWEVTINGTAPGVEKTNESLGKTINILDSLYPKDETEITYHKKSESSEDITPGDVVTTKDGDEVKVTDTNPEDDSYVGEVLDESGQPDPNAAPKNFDGEDVDHKGIDTPEPQDDEEYNPYEDSFFNDAMNDALNDINNYEPAPSDAKPNKNQVDAEGNPLDKNGKPIKKGSSVQLHKANGDLWIEGTVEAISGDKKRIKVKDSATGKLSYRLPHKITVTDSEESAPLAPKPPRKTEQKVSDALSGLEDGEFINVNNNDKSFTKNTNDNGDPVLIDHETNTPQEIPEFIESNSETDVDSGVAYSNLQFTPESKEISDHSQDDEGDQTPEGYPDNMGIDVNGFQYIRNADNEKMFIGDYVTNKKGELIGKITAFDGGKLLGKRLKVERPDGTSSYRKPEALKLYKDDESLDVASNDLPNPESEPSNEEANEILDIILNGIPEDEEEETAPTSIDEILDDPLLDTPEADEKDQIMQDYMDGKITYDELKAKADKYVGDKEAEEEGPKYESIADAAKAYQDGDISYDEYAKFVDDMINGEISPETTPEEDAGPVNEQTTEPEVLPVSFDILPADERGASGDGYHASGPWGKFGASGMMIQAKDPNTGENKYLLTQRSQSLSSNKGKWQLPGGAKDEFENDYQGAARETSEELGLDQDDLHQITYVADNIYDNGQGWTYNNIAVTSPTMYDVTPQDNESSDAKWFTAAELQQMKNQGDLVPAFAENIDTLLESYGDSDSGPTETDLPTPDSDGPTGTEGIDFALDMNGNSFSAGDMVDWPAQKKSGTVNAVMSADKVHVIFEDGSSKNLNPKKKLKSIQKSEEKVSSLEGSDKPTPPDTSDLDAQIAEIDKKFALGIPTQEILDDIEYMYDVEKKHASTKSHYSESKYFKMHGDQLKEDNTDLGAVEGAANILNQKYLLSDDTHKKITKKVMDIESNTSEDKAKHSSLTEQKKQALSEYETELKAWNKANGIKINTKLGAKIAPLSNEAEQDLNPSSWNESLPGTSNLEASLEHFENDIASRSNGVGILMDTQEVENQEMRVNRLIDANDNDVNRTTFRVSGDKIDEFLNKFKGKFGSNITSDMYKVLRQKIQTDGQLKEYDDTPLGMKFSYGKKFTATLPDGTKISYSIDEDSKHTDSTSGSAIRADYDGLVQIDTPVSGGSESIQNALNEFGITEARPTNVDDLKREAAKLLFNQINGFKGYFAETPSDDQLNKFLKKLEKDTGIKLSDVQMSRDHLGTNKLMLTKDGLEKLKNTYKVPKTYTHGFSGGPEDLAKNLSSKTPGLVSSKQRFASGIQSGGISVYTDTTYGSNAYVFMRPSNDEYKPGLHLNSDIVFRHLKQVHSNNDNYGKPKMKSKPWKDQSDNSDWFAGSAETEVVSTLDASAWKYYVVSSIYDKNHMVDLLKKHGTYTINGIPVEEFVVVKGGPLPQYDDSMLDYSGDENATIIPDGPIGGV